MTNYPKPGGLKHKKELPSRFRGQKSKLDQSYGASSYAFLLEVPAEGPSFPASRSHLHSVALGSSHLRGQQGAGRPSSNTASLSLIYGSLDHIPTLTIQGHLKVSRGPPSFPRPRNRTFPQVSGARLWASWAGRSGPVRFPAWGVRAGCEECPSGGRRPATLQPCPGTEEAFVKADRFLLGSQCPQMWVAFQLKESRRHLGQVEAPRISSSFPKCDHRAELRRGDSALQGEAVSPKGGDCPLAPPFPCPSVPKSFSAALRGLRSPVCLSAPPRPAERESPLKCRIQASARKGPGRCRAGFPGALRRGQRAWLLLQIVTDTH